MNPLVYTIDKVAATLNPTDINKVKTNYLIYAIHFGLSLKLSLKL